ncbi:hypothetical protein J6590_098486 [Homalodisca vitripennis]|nr:hypothetical protein J6590_098486 [Homalodisca vitripennis]
MPQLEVGTGAKVRTLAKDLATDRCSRRTRALRKKVIKWPGSATFQLPKAITCKKPSRKLPITDRDFVAFDSFVSSSSQN